jgi:hypothetical protein
MLVGLAFLISVFKLLIWKSSLLQLVCLITEIVYIIQFADRKYHYASENDMLVMIFKVLYFL